MLGSCLESGNCDKIRQLYMTKNVISSILRFFAPSNLIDDYSCTDKTTSDVSLRWPYRTVRGNVHVSRMFPLIPHVPQIWCLVANPS
jgi:hypothetical protein